MGIELTPAAKVLLATKGYDPVLGARPLRRTIQRDIEDAALREDPLRRAEARRDRGRGRRGRGRARRVHLPGCEEGRAARRPAGGDHGREPPRTAAPRPPDLLSTTAGPPPSGVAALLHASLWKLSSPIRDSVDATAGPPGGVLWGADTLRRRPEDRRGSRFLPRSSGRADCSAPTAGGTSSARYCSSCHWPHIRGPRRGGRGRRGTGSGRRGHASHRLPDGSPDEGRRQGPARHRLHRGIRHEAGPVLRDRPRPPHRRRPPRHRHDHGPSVVARPLPGEGRLGGHVRLTRLHRRRQAHRLGVLHPRHQHGHRRDHAGRSAPARAGRVLRCRREQGRRDGRPLAHLADQGAGAGAGGRRCAGRRGEFGLLEDQVARVGLGHPSKRMLAAINRIPDIRLVSSSAKASAGAAPADTISAGGNFVAALSYGDVSFVRRRDHDCRVRRQGCGVRPPVLRGRSRPDERSRRRGRVRAAGLLVRCVQARQPGRPGRRGRQRSHHGDPRRPGCEAASTGSPPRSTSPAGPP